MSALFIAFEGGEACGKSTQAKLLADRIGALLTREPGGTEYGERVRSLFQNQADLLIGARAEALLVASARAQHVEEVIRPALDKGQSVVTDRYLASSLAYQGFARGLDVTGVFELSAWASETTFPDLTILIEVSRATAIERLKTSGQDADRFEQESDEFHQRVAEGYLHLASADSDNWIVVNGNGTVEEVEKAVTSAFESWCTKNGVDV